MRKHWTGHLSFIPADLLHPTSNCTAGIVVCHQHDLRSWRIDRQHLIKLVRLNKTADTIVVTPFGVHFDSEEPIGSASGLCHWNGSGHWKWCQRSSDIHLEEMLNCISWFTVWRNNDTGWRNQCVQPTSAHFPARLPRRKLLLVSSASLALKEAVVAWFWYKSEPNSQQTRLPLSNFKYIFVCSSTAVKEETLGKKSFKNVFFRDPSSEMKWAYFCQQKNFFY